ncbi:glycosyltransferase [Nakamurella deserti]|uniref:glycosyltransferase n=1 Tax=Nakamurella deserti TaxID=2164074 RepID=UPI000DBE8BE0|nr:glycosyltransferase [Nakamurella deserti]
MSGEVIRVASIPSAHPYVEHLGDPAGDRVHRLPDPLPAVADPLPGQWWPPVMLEPEWVRDHPADFDVMHLHFGFDAASPDRLRQWVAALRATRKPLVFTVHDLVNPHFADPGTHLAALDVLVPAADAVLTLTAGAAAEIGARWGRHAMVVPHPHVVPLDRLRTPADRPGTGAGRFVVGLSAKNLRANIDPVPLLAALLPALPGLPGVHLEVDVHREVMDPSRTDPRAVAFRALVAEHHDHPRFSVIPHDRYSDEELFAHLEALDLSVLPYRFGTHSGWLEACVDLGTAVLVPDTGHYAGQHGHPTYRFPGGRGVGGTDLVERVTAVQDGRVDARPPRPDRLDQRRRVAATHRQVYDGVLAATSG